MGVQICDPHVAGLLAQRVEHAEQDAAVAAEQQREVPVTYHLSDTSAQSSVECHNISHVADAADGAFEVSVRRLGDNVPEIGCGDPTCETEASQHGWRLVDATRPTGAVRA